MVAQAFLGGPTEPATIAERADTPGSEHKIPPDAEGVIGLTIQHPHKQMAYGFS